MSTGAPLGSSPTAAAGVAPSSAGVPTPTQSLTSTSYTPLAKPEANGAVPRVTLSIPLGKTAAQTSADMDSARARTSFEPLRIEEVLRDGRIDNATRHEVIATLDKDEVFGDWKKRMIHLNREQKMAMSHAACRRLLEIAEREGWGTHEIVDAAISLDLQSPVTIHWVAFVPVILGQGDAEQVERWGTRSMDHNILGCYLQTELGHGTNVQALETTATYNEKTDTFDLHSPTLTSTKWWAGGSGLTATHGIVQAQLIIKGKYYGPHLFFTPLRSIDDGKLFPGIVAGDIGPKTYDAFAGLDNGWVRFDHVTLPRNNMLAKHAQVKKGGEYVRPPNDKLSYGGMIFIRSQMIDRTGWMLSRGITIAMRYALVRRQFRDPDSQDRNETERSVLSYPSVNRRLVPLLAKSYAYIIAGRRMRTLYEDMAEQLDSGNTALLADVHVASSSLKAYCTKQACDGIEASRASLGGHGFSAYSGFTSLFPDNLPSQTYEGDNYVLMQQVGRAMLKTAGELETKPDAKVSNTMSFLRALDTPNQIKFTSPTSPAEWLQPAVYTAALDLRTARRVGDLRAEVRSGRRFVDLSWDCVEVANSHAEVVVNAWFTEGVRDDAERFGPSSTEWINKLVVLHALGCVARDVTPLALPAPEGRQLAGFAPGSAILKPEALLHLETAIRDLTAEILPQVIGYTDAFGWTDWELGSRLGRKDGRVYEALMAEAEGNPINHPEHPERGIDGVGRYQYGSPDTGKHVLASWKTDIHKLLHDTAARSELGKIRGDGSKL